MGENKKRSMPKKQKKTEKPNPITFNLDSDYVKFNSLEKSTYYEFPKWLMKPEYNFIDAKAKLIYMLIFDTCKLSYENFRKEKFRDDFEFWDYDKFTSRCKISYSKFMSVLGISSKSTVNKYLDQLIELNLIEKKKNFGSTTFYYVKKYKHEIELVYETTKVHEVADFNEWKKKKDQAIGTSSVL